MEAKAWTKAKLTFIDGIIKTIPGENSRNHLTQVCTFYWWGHWSIELEAGPLWGLHAVLISFGPQSFAFGLFRSLPINIIKEKVFQITWPVPGLLTIANLHSLTLFVVFQVDVDCFWCLFLPYFCFLLIYFILLI